MSGVEACYIRLHRERVKKRQRSIIDQLITKSRYSAMDRNERRTFEYYADEIAQLKAQQKDLKKAKIVAQRVGVILERLRKDLQQLKHHVSNYDFVSTEGQDTQTASCADGTGYNSYEATCGGQGDLSMDGATRHAWIERAKNMLTGIRNFSLAQRLGNYSLLWNPQDLFVTNVLQGGVIENNCPTPATDCAPAASAVSSLFYRQEFLYMQYSTTCRTTTKQAQSEQDTDDAHPAHASPGGDMPLDQNTSKKNCNYFSISNPDLEINDLWKELVCHVQDADDDGNVDQHDIDENENDDVENIVDKPPCCSFDMIDDERDVACVLRMLISKLDDVMHAQQDNDNEQSALCCAQEVSQQNLCWFESICAEMSEIDEDELKSKHTNGEALLGDLTDLFRKSSSKKDYFNCVEITSTGASWY